MNTFLGFTVCVAFITMISEIWFPSIILLKILMTCAVILSIGLMLYTNKGEDQCKISK